jgi:hypothetical protein
MLTVHPSGRWMVGAVGIELLVSLKARKLLILRYSKIHKNLKSGMPRYTRGTQHNHRFLEAKSCPLLQILHVVITVLHGVRALLFPSCFFSSWPRSFLRTELGWRSTLCRLDDQTGSSVTGKSSQVHKKPRMRLSEKRTSPSSTAAIALQGSPCQRSS